MADIKTGCPECGWDKEVTEDEFDSIDFKETYCEDGCASTLMYTRL